jgi:hypothetical protein
MKTQLRNLFSPILNRFDTDDATLVYKQSHRSILIAVSLLFLFLSIVSLIAASYVSGPDSFIAFIVFFCVSAVCGIVGFLGSDQAVARI